MSAILSTITALADASQGPEIGKFGDGHPKREGLRS